MIVQPLHVMLREAAGQAVSVVRLKAFNTSTETGRSQERYRRVLLTAVAALGSKVFGLAVMLVSVPLTLRYLGVERYGVWITLSSLMAALSFADLGMGNGLINAVSTSSGRDDNEAARCAISCAWFSLWGVAILLGLGFAAILPWIEWAPLLNISSTLVADEAKSAVAVFAAGFVLGLPLGVACVTQRGLQEGFANSAWTAAANGLSLILLLLGVAIHATLPTLVALLMGGPLVANLLNHMTLFTRRHGSLSPRAALVTWHGIKSILGIGFQFLCLQIAGALAFASPNIVISQVLGPSQVPIFAIPQRLYSVIPLFLGTFNSALWPAFGEALSRGDYNWTKKTLKHSVSASLAFAGLPCGFFAFAGAAIMRRWVGNTVQFPRGLFFGLSLVTFLSAIAGPMSAFLNGANAVSFQAISALIFGLSQVALSVYFTRRLGVQGVPWAMVLTYTVCQLVPYCVIIQRLLQQSQCMTLCSENDLQAQPTPTRCLQPLGPVPMGVNR